MAVVIDGTTGITTPTGTGDVSVGDDLTFTGTGNRITGDFSNATFVNRVSFQSSTTNGATVVQLIPNGASTSAQLAVFGGSDILNTSVGQLTNNGTEVRVASGIFGTGTYSPMTFYTGGSERVRVDTSGNVGIATSSPRVRLDVRSDAVIAAPTPLANAVASGVFAIGDSVGSVIGLQLNGSSYDTYFQARNMGAGSTAYNLLLQPLGGNVGIGTSSPAALLSFGSTASGSSDGARIYLRNNTNEFAIGTNGTQSVYAGFQGHVWQTGSFGGTERARIDASGNLLVGTTSLPTQGATGTGIYGNAGRINIANNSTSATAMAFYSSTQNTGTITTTATTTAYVTSSDYRLKENVQPMTGALEKVQALSPVTYTWKVDGSAGQGFIAHELQAVVPDAVTGEKDAVDKDGKPIHQGVDTSFLVATLTAAIQEQQAIITSLTARIEVLENQ